MIFKDLSGVYKDAYNFVHRNSNSILAGDLVDEKVFVTVNVIDKKVNSNDFCIVFINSENVDIWESIIDNYSDLNYTYFQNIKNQISTGSFTYLKEKFDIVFVMYDDLEDNYVLLKSMATNRFTIQDDANFIKDYNDVMVDVLTSICDNSYSRLGLVDLSIKNYVVDFWNIMQFYDSSILGSKENFKNKYCKLSYQVFGTKVVNGKQIPRKEDSVVGYRNLNDLEYLKSRFIFYLDGEQKKENDVNNKEDLLSNIKNNEGIVVKENFNNIKHERKKKKVCI